MRLTQAPDAPNLAPVFILSASRSGSTLLRFILDSHPDFACPPETGVSGACAMFARLWGTLEHGGSGERWMPGDEVVLSAAAAAAIRTAVDQAFSGYLHRTAKVRWCDKSLEAYEFADIVRQVYPEAKFILLTRHVMDVVASGVESCPWGLHRFGFDPFVTQYPGNSVSAIGAYWLTCVHASLDFAEKHPAACHQVRYEDLVTAPDEIISAIFSFLGVDQVPGIAEACFSTPHDQDGPGDEKIWFTSGIKADSMGRGVVVPAAALVPPLRKPINDVLARLGYRIVDEKWNAAIGRVDPRAGQSPSSARGDDVNGLGTAMSAIRSQIESRRPAELADIAFRWPTVAGTTVGIIVEAASGQYEEFRWQFPGATPEDEEHQDIPRFIAGPDAWMSVLEGRSNLVSEITGSRLRCINPKNPERLRSDEIHAIGALLGVARMPVARREPVHP